MTRRDARTLQPACYAPRATRAGALLCALTITLAGCGQTGPLYFDEAPPADQLPPSKKTSQPATVPQPEPDKPL